MPGVNEKWRTDRRTGDEYFFGRKIFPTVVVPTLGNNYCDATRVQHAKSVPDTAKNVGVTSKASKMGDSKKARNAKRCCAQ